MSPLLQLAEFGQSYWIDYLARSELLSGALARRVALEGLRGVTSNPKIFHDAMLKEDAYDEQIERGIAEGKTALDIYETLAISDVQAACDVLGPVHQASHGRDGFVSLEVSPYLARDARASIAEGKRLAARVDRPNLMIKIPGTREGLVAIEELLYEGINVNVTLLFSVERYRQAAAAHLRALERRRAGGAPLDGVHSVASFFLSRIDVSVDLLLAGLQQGPNADAPSPRELRGRAAIANAKLAYRTFCEMLEQERWLDLARSGAHPQRLLWASTGTKDPNFSDVKYVEALIGPKTVTTLPVETIRAFADHGVVRETLTEDVEGARRVLLDLERVGIDFQRVASQLEEQGIQKFAEPFTALLRELEDKRRRALPRSSGGSAS
jgi:transaldolase